MNEKSSSNTTVRGLLAAVARSRVFELEMTLSVCDLLEYVMRSARWPARPTRWAVHAPDGQLLRAKLPGRPPGPKGKGKGKGGKGAIYTPYGDQRLKERFSWWQPETGYMEPDRVTGRGWVLALQDVYEMTTWTQFASATPRMQMLKNNFIFKVHVDHEQGPVDKKKNDLFGSLRAMDSKERSLWEFVARDLSTL